MKKEVLSAETKRSLALLDALEACGVDNWDGYDYAIDMLNEDEFVDDPDLETAGEE